MKRTLSIFVSCLMLGLMMLVGSAHSANFSKRPAAETVVEWVHSKPYKEGWVPPQLKIHIYDTVRFVNKRNHIVWIECVTCPAHKDKLRFRLTELDPIEVRFDHLGTYKLVCKHGGPSFVPDPKDNPGEEITIEVVRP